MPASFDPAPFRPPPWLRNRHAQTVWANWAARPASHERLTRVSRPQEVRVLDDRLRLLWSDVDDPTAPILIVLHGLTGCAASPMVVGVAVKAHALGFRVCRVDLRNSSADTPSRQVGHAGRSEDLHAVIARTAEEWPGAPIGVVGFSLGGNIAFKAVGEYGDRPPAALRALVGVSVPIDLARSCEAIDSLTNFHYRYYFLTRLRDTIARRKRTVPELYAGIEPPGSWSIRDFDNDVIAPLGGFRDAADYYARSSCVQRLPDIRVPSLLIHASDDPFIPMDIYRDRRLDDAPHVKLLETPHGGHVGFWAARAERTGAADPDRFWSEHRAVEFVRRALAHD